MFRIQYEDRHPVKKNKTKKFLIPEKFETQGKENRWLKKNSWGLRNAEIVERVTTK